MLDNQELEYLKELLISAKNICIIIHKNPDGDAVGSALALKYFLQNFNKSKVNVISPNVLPSFFEDLEKKENILVYEKNPMLITDKIVHSDMLFFLDLNDMKRTGLISEIVSTTNMLKVMIDHHPNPQMIVDFSISEPEKSSTAEIVWNFTKLIDNQKITKEVAYYSLLGILSDTGCLCFNSVKKETYETVAEIMSYGVDKTEIINQLYNNYTENRLRLLGYLIYKKLKVFEDKKTAYISLTLEEKEKFNYQPGDHESVSNYPLSLKNVIFSALFVENPDNEIKISLRSKGDFAVNEIASKYFSGGGHKNAAGGIFHGTMEDLTNFFENKILKNL